MGLPDPTIYIVDRDPFVGWELSRLVRSAGYQAAFFQCPTDFLRAHDESALGCLVFEDEMHGELRDALRIRSGITLTALGTIEVAVGALRSGAINVLTKPVDQIALLASIAEALAIDTRRWEEVRRGNRIRARLSTLTHRERQVLEHVVRGRTNNQIADDLGTVEKTIKVHRARVMRKLQVRTLAELVSDAGVVGLVEDWWAAAKPPKVSELRREPAQFAGAHSRQTG
jgi:RNA polymerase sigma factor (sigma-70 family)